MIESIILKFTETPDINVSMDGITIFVGANNSGKSLVLREIGQIFEDTDFINLNMVRDFELSWPEENKLMDFINIHAVPNSLSIDGNIHLNRFSGNGIQSGTLHVDSAKNIVKGRDSQHKLWLTRTLLKYGVLTLSGQARFTLTNDMPIGDLLRQPQNALQRLFQDNSLREKVSSYTKEAFNLYYVLDPTNVGQLRVRLSPHPDAPDNQSLSAEAREYYKNTFYIKSMSDGVQAFCGILTAVMAGNYHTIFMDEPEAFLHPPLAKKLGKIIGSHVKSNSGTLLAATHSADFLLGCIQASNNVRVIRLEYSNGKSRGRLVAPDKLEKILRHPLMRSSNVASALFYDGVVVTESDNDRALYNEIYSRIADSRNDVPSILFLNAQNKQTIREILGPLRDFGVPTAAIVDIDVIKDGGNVWTNWLSASRVPEALHPSFSSSRQAIKACFETAKIDMKTNGGVSALNASDKKSANKFFNDLAEYGVFVVRNGELESWLSDLGVEANKRTWTIDVLQRLGGDPSDSLYVKPQKGDVWAFIEGIIGWIKNPEREGLDG